MGRPPFSAAGDSLCGDCLPQIYKQRKDRSNMRPMQWLCTIHATIASMQLTELETFVVVCRTGSLTATARELHISQPALTRRIASLEKYLGVSVLERSGRRLVPTTAGQIFCNYVEEGLSVLHDGAERLRDTQGTGGTLTIAVVGTLANSQVVAALRKFYDRHPGWEVGLRTATSSGVSALVRQGAADVGLRYNFGRSDPKLLSVETLHERLIPVGRRGHSYMSPPQERTWLVFPSTDQERDPYRKELATYLNVDDLSRVRLLEVDSLTAQLGLTSAGFGCALLPETAVIPVASTHQLEQLPGSNDFKLQIDVITRTSTVTRPVVTQLVREIESHWNRAVDSASVKSRVGHTDIGGD